MRRKLIFAPTIHGCSKLIQAYNILLLSVFVRTVQLVYLQPVQAHSNSDMPFTEFMHPCLWGVNQGERMGECVGEQEKALFHSNCQSWTTEPVRQQTPTASIRNTTCETKQDLGVVFNTTILIRLLCLDFSNGSTYYLENNMEHGFWHRSIFSNLRGDYVA